ncbi:MAG: hypothetical protein R2838_19350 [Caldilineaceae bacterium]
MTTNTRPMRSTDVLIMLAGSLAGVTAVLTAAALLPSLTAQEPAALTAAGAAVTTTLRQEAATMALPLTDATSAYWYMARAGGIVAYLLLWFATFWGVAMSGKMTKGALAALLFDLHEFFPFLAVTFAALHAMVLLGDEYINFQVRDLLLPFTASYEPVWTGLGTVAFYPAAALIASFYVRKQIGPAGVAGLPLPGLPRLCAGPGPRLDGRQRQRTPRRARHVPLHGHERALRHLLPHLHGQGETGQDPRRCGHTRPAHTRRAYRDNASCRPLYRPLRMTR